MSTLRSSRLIAVLTCASALSVALVADAALRKTGDAEVTFLAIGPAGMKIEGKTTELNASEDGANVKITVPLSNVATGIALRDRHLKEKYLQVSANPNAELVVPRASLSFPADGASASGRAKGKLTLHGVTKDADFTYESARKGDTYKVTGKVKINIKDYNIEVPSYLGVTVQPDVDVTAKFEVADK
jgi:polyisoprenoid-binding protein YceI